MLSQTLYIIGNGFDLYHNIPSRFSQFKRFVKNNDNELFQAIEEYLPVDDSWSDLEESFARIDIDHMTEECSSFLQSYNSEDWSDSYHHDYQYEISNNVNLLSARLVQRFEEWVGQLKIPEGKDISNDRLSLNPDGLYLSFNYTSTLVNLYKIQVNRILYIHGSVENSSSDIVLGHAWNPREIPSINSHVELDNIDARVMEGNDILESYFSDTFKPTREIINTNKKYFSGLSHVSSIYVLGHSLSVVDIDYFKEIFCCVKNAARWYVSYYSGEELNHHRDVISELGVSLDRVKFFELAAGIPT